MSSELDHMVAVVALGGQPPESLRLMCQKNGWLCVVAGEALQVLRAVRRKHMLVIIVEVSPADARSTELLQLLRHEASEATVIAVVAHHEDRLERNIRAAGAHWYVPTVTETALLERMVASILKERETLYPLAGRCRPEPAGCGTSLLLSSPREARAAGVKVPVAPAE